LVVDGSLHAEIEFSSDTFALLLYYFGNDYIGKAVIGYG